MYSISELAPVLALFLAGCTVCEASDFLDGVKRRPPSEVTEVPRVQCTYSVKPDNKTCRGNECCPGAEETGNKTYPCPNARSDWVKLGKCEAPKPISCGKMTVYGQEICEQDPYCTWTKWTRDFTQCKRNRTAGGRRRNKCIESVLSESCTFSRQYKSTCYPPLNLTHVPQQLGCKGPDRLVGQTWGTFETNSGWPEEGMDWQYGKTWNQLKADVLHPKRLRAAKKLGWNRTTWHQLTVVSRGDYKHTNTFPPSTHKYWTQLNESEQEWAGTLGWNEVLWNYNVITMAGSHKFQECWPPVVYVPYEDLNYTSKLGVQDLGWYGENVETHLNHVFWEDPGDQIHGWPASQCQDYDHVDHHAVDKVFPDKLREKCDIRAVWNFYFSTLDPLCPTSNPSDVTRRRRVPV